MSEKQFDFSIRMDKEDSVPKEEDFDFAIKPDTKGPKTVAVLMLFGGILLLLLAYGDFQLSQKEDLTQAEIDIVLETPNSDIDTEITKDEVIKIKKDNIITSTNPDTNLIDAYDKNTSSLVKPKTKLIV